MTGQQVIDLFLDRGALLKGHFRLSSGLHSDTYLQCARVLMIPHDAARLGQALATGLEAAGVAVDVVVSPALGGVIIGHEVARALGRPHVFTERKEGQMLLRRGFSFEMGQRVVIVEDVVTTGKSTREVMAVMKEHGAQVAACASIINRSGQENPFADLGISYVCLAQVSAEAWPADQLPPHLQNVPVSAPGSRHTGQ